MVWNKLAAGAALALVLAAPAAAQAPATPVPAFTYDIAWMKVPARYVTGDITAVAVDRHDNVWVMHRPRTISEADRGRAAPPVMQFDSSGRFIRAWGGPGPGYDWPLNEHSLHVDGQDRVWLSGSLRNPGASDDAVLAFTADGKFIRQIGRENASRGDQDTANVKAAADLYVDDARRELYVADGYGNRRLIVFDTETGAFKRMWGAFGAPPPTTPKGPPPPAMRPEGAPNQTGEGAREFGDVHGVEIARDGTVYVSDRASQRIQAFDRDGRYQAQGFVHRDAPSRQTASGMALSTDPAQRWLFVTDWGNGSLVVLERKTLAEAATIGGKGTAPGQFVGPHLLAFDSKGALYVSEVQGRRLQKLTPKP